MFSVDNFYTIFDARYGWDRTKTMLYATTIHGSKDIRDFRPMDKDDLYIKNPWYFNTQGGSAILYDQEVFVRYLLNTYRQDLVQQKKRNFWLQIDDANLISRWLKSLSWPIWCHSEPGSEDVRYLEEQGFISCHYFWHGLIARDWYRDYRHHYDLTNKSTADYEKRFLLYIRAKNGTRSYRSHVINELLHMRSDILENWDSNDVTSDFSAKIEPQDAIKSGIHLVAETLFDLDRVHVTEKMFKPIVMKQPFIVFGGAGTLNYMRKYGFKTFSSIWNEDYDLETNHDKRMHMVVELIKQLNKKSKSEFDRMLVECQDIVDFNREHFYSNKFEDIMLNEWYKNFESAMEIQKEKMIIDPGGSYYHYGDFLDTLPDSIDKRLDLEHFRQSMECVLKNDVKKGALLMQRHPWIKNL